MVMSQVICKVLDFYCKLFHKKDCKSYVEFSEEVLGMDNELLDDFGSYMPGYYFLKLNCKLDKNAGLKGAGLKERFTFIHEYIHYLQDITTFGGYNQYVYNMKKLLLYIKESKKFETIIKLNKDLQMIDDMLYKQGEILAVREGNSHFVNFAIVNRIKKDIDEIMSDEIGKEQEVVIIHYNGNKEYVFGSASIKESMAYLIEKKISSEERVSQLPYNCCEILCEELIPSLLEQPHIIVALCEVALMSNNPGNMFYDMLCIMKEKKISFKTTKEVMNEFLDNKMIEELLIKKDEYLKLLDKIYEVNEFKNTKIRIINNVGKGIENRIEYPNLISKIMELNLNDSVKFLELLMELFGLPLIIDIENKLFADDENLMYAMIPFSALNILSNQFRQDCLYYDYCKKSDNINCLTDCKDKPWKQAEKIKQCALGVFWKEYIGCKSVYYDKEIRVRHVFAA